MIENFTIVSREDQTILELRAFDNDRFIAEVRSPGLQATASVGSYMSTGLGDFFGDLAVHWRGGRVLNGGDRLKASSN